MSDSEALTDAGAAFRVLLVDDEIPLLRVNAASLAAEGFTDVVTEADSTRVMERIQRDRPHLVLLDLTMPGLSGEELIPLIRREHPELPVVVVTGTVSLDTAVACMKAGATDYVVKPVERQKLVAIVRTFAALEQLGRENAALARHLVGRRLEHAEAFDEIITRDPALRAIFQYVEAIAPSSAPVLITGETGTGKELFARAIHRASGRTGELVSVNAAGLDDTMFSDLLFGHRKGAFTSADQPLAGLVKRADAGTLFLDEIGDLPAASQLKLLRLAESGEYYPLGQDIVQRSGARIVVATNRDLESAAASGSFRRDLFFRLSTHRVRVPPLRDRCQDIELLVPAFIEEAARDLGKRPPRCGPGALSRLVAYDFPGNVRELRSMIVEAVSIQAGDELDPSHFPALGPGACADDVRPPEISFGEALPTIRQAVQALIREALERSGNNQTAAARLLGISQQALSKRLKNPQED